MLACLCRPTFWRICKAKDVEEFKPDPYLATLLNCMLWVFYGIPIVHPNSILVVTINGIGLVIEAAYLTIFFLYSDGKKRVSAMALSACRPRPPSPSPRSDLIFSLIPFPLILLILQKKALAILAVEILFMVVVVLCVLLTSHTHEKRSMVVGILCVIFGSMMYASPLTIMVRVIIRSLSLFSVRRSTGAFESAASLIIFLLNCVDNFCRRVGDQVATSN